MIDFLKRMIEQDIDKDLALGINSDKGMDYIKEKGDKLIKFANKHNIWFISNLLREVASYWIYANWYYYNKKKGDLSC